MADREKIVNAIEKAKKQSEEYAQDHIVVPFKEADMILALLKEQEPVEPFEEGINDFNCGKCGAGLSVDNDWKYCPHCGKKVKWD